MISKNQTKSLYYIDRDTNIDDLSDEIIRVKKLELSIFLENQKDKLQGKEAGEYYTLEDVTKLKDGELENMNRFFRGAVVPYYVRQKYNAWDKKLTSVQIIEGTKEIKESVGFMLYDHTGHITEDVNSLTTFNRVKDLRGFLTMIEEVCFDDNEFIFPNSKHFKGLVNQKGRDVAERQVISELHEQIKNKYYEREIL